MATLDTIVENRAVQTAMNRLVSEDKPQVVSVPGQSSSSSTSTEFTLDQQGQILSGQVEVNKLEAQQASIFVSGWRPFIGWVCGIALLYQYMISPLLPWVVNAFGGHVPPMPVLDRMLGELVIALLGLGFLRTAEKYGGVARN
jgi:hypothetical protein